MAFWSGCDDLLVPRDRVLEIGEITKLVPRASDGRLRSIIIATMLRVTLRGKMFTFPRIGLSKLNTLLGLILTGEP